MFWYETETKKALSGDSVPTFWENKSVPYSRVKKSKTLEDGTDRSSRSVGIMLPFVISQKSAYLIYVATEA
jgi:hypothetical protein